MYKIHGSKYILEKLDDLPKVSLLNYASPSVNIYP